MNKQAIRFRCKRKTAVARERERERRIGPVERQAASSTPAEDGAELRFRIRGGGKHGPVFAEFSLFSPLCVGGPRFRCSPKCYTYRYARFNCLLFCARVPKFMLMLMLMLVLVLAHAVLLLPYYLTYKEQP